MSDWVPFSHRYGSADKQTIWDWCERGEEDFQAEAWRSRHNEECSLLAGLVGEPDPMLRCACPGSGGRHRCADRASQEDRLCDACREHCWAVDERQHQHRLIDVYGART